MNHCLSQLTRFFAAIHASVLPHADDDLHEVPLEQSALRDSKSEVVSKLGKLLDAWKETLPDNPTGDVFSNLRKDPEKP